MGIAVWRVTEKPNIAIFGAGLGPGWPHGEIGLDDLGGRGGRGRRRPWTALRPCKDSFLMLQSEPRAQMPLLEERQLPQLQVESRLLEWSQNQ